MFKKIARKIYRALFPIQEVKIPATIIGKERSVSLDPSAILSTSKNGRIIFEGNNYIGRQVEIGTEGTVQIGFGTTIQDRCILLGDVDLGKYCTFAPNVYISSGRHYYDHKPNFYVRDQDEMVHSDVELSKQHSKKVVIEDDVWIGINCVIMSGVKIGRGAVIGSNSVVTKDVLPFSVMAGLPAREIKKRLDLIPKSVLSFNSSDDLPNFYKGVFVDMKNIIADKKLGGLSTSKDFVLYLKEGGKVQLTVRKNISSPLTLAYNKQKAELSNEFTDVTFEMSNDNFHHFSAVGNSGEAEKLVLIREVKVIS